LFHPRPNLLLSRPAYHAAPVSLTGIRLGESGGYVTEACPSTADADNSTG
jgi:hypothetical protein